MMMRMISLIKWEGRGEKRRKRREEKEEKRREEKVERRWKRK